MGMPTVITQSGTGLSAVWTPDWMQTPFSVGMAVVPAGATTTVQATYDDLNSIAAASAVWFTVMTVTGINATAALTAPVRGLQLNVVTSLSTGIVTATFIQATFGR